MLAIGSDSLLKIMHHQCASLTNMLINYPSQSSNSCFIYFTIKVDNKDTSTSKTVASKIIMEKPEMCPLDTDALTFPTLS